MLCAGAETIRLFVRTSGTILTSANRPLRTRDSPFLSTASNSSTEALALRPPPRAASMACWSVPADLVRQRILQLEYPYARYRAAFVHIDLFDEPRDLRHVALRGTNDQGVRPRLRDDLDPRRKSLVLVEELHQIQCEPASPKRTSAEKRGIGSPG